jgi:hypothetical protein
VYVVGRLKIETRNSGQKGNPMSKITRREFVKWETLVPLAFTPLNLAQQTTPTPAAEPVTAGPKSEVQDEGWPDLDFGLAGHES